MIIQIFCLFLRIALLNSYIEILWDIHCSYPYALKHMLEKVLRVNYIINQVSSRLRNHHRFILPMVNYFLSLSCFPSKHACTIHFLWCYMIFCSLPNGYSCTWHPDYYSGLDLSVNLLTRSSVCSYRSIKWYDPIYFLRQLVSWHSIDIFFQGISYRKF